MFIRNARTMISLKLNVHEPFLKRQGPVVKTERALWSHLKLGISNLVYVSAEVQTPGPGFPSHNYFEMSVAGSHLKLQGLLFPRPAFQTECPRVSSETSGPSFPALHFKASVLGSHPNILQSHVAPPEV